MENTERNQISYAKIVSKEEILSLNLLPQDNLLPKLKEGSGKYLWIFIPSNNILKMSMNPIKENCIQKLILRLDEFSPSIIKAITEMINNLGLDKRIVHSTGLCFSGEDCYYETYIECREGSTKIKMQNFKDTFNKIASVRNIEIIEYK